MRGGHESRHLLVPRLNERNFISSPAHRTEYAVDAVTGIAIDAPHTPLMQSLDNEVSDCSRHDLAL
jgi:hypothetical protein